MEISDFLSKCEEKYGLIEEELKLKIEHMLKMNLISEDQQGYILNFAESTYKRLAYIQKNRLENKITVDKLNKTLQEFINVANEYASSVAKLTESIGTLYSTATKTQSKILELEKEFNKNYEDFKKSNKIFEELKNKILSFELFFINPENKRPI